MFEPTVSISSLSMRDGPSFFGGEVLHLEPVFVVEHVGYSTEMRHRVPLRSLAHDRCSGRAALFQVLLSPVLSPQVLLSLRRL